MDEHLVFVAGDIDGLTLACMMMNITLGRGTIASIFM
jgi:hypothetical protein